MVLAPLQKLKIKYELSYQSTTRLKYIDKYEREDFSQSSLIDGRSPVIRDDWETSSSFKKTSLIILSLFCIHN